VRRWGAGLLVVAAVCLIALVITNAFAFWHDHPSMTWQTCAFGDAPCSTAAATWSLTLVGLFAFGAAILTVQYAARSFGLETEPTLGQSPCVHYGDHHLADRTLFVTEGGQLLTRFPVGVTEENVLETYAPPVHVAFENLGRTPLAGVRVALHIECKDGAFTRRVICDIGNIKRDRERHVVIYIDKTLEPFSVAWCDATQRGPAVAFRSENPVVQSVTSRLSVIGEADGGEQQLEFEILLSAAEEAPPDGESEDPPYGR
jgi:hypothetical protein